MNSRYQVLDLGFQSLSGFWTPWAEFRILKSRIPESTGKNLAHSGISIPLHGVKSSLIESILYEWISKSMRCQNCFFWNQRKHHICCVAINIEKIGVLWFRALNCLLKLSHHEFPTSFPNVRVHFVLFVVSAGEYCSGSHKSSATRIFHRGILKQQLRCSRSSEGDEQWRISEW